MWSSAETRINTGFLAHLSISISPALPPVFWARAGQGLQPRFFFRGPFSGSTLENTSWELSENFRPASRV